MNSQEFLAYTVTLHRDMLNRLVILCQDRETAYIQRLEAAVQVCTQYLQDLYAVVPDEGFETGDEEIRFFKSIKPLFAAEREYHQRLYHATVFGTDNDRFWSHEKWRMEKLLEEHSGFIRYFHDGETNNDAAWFTQGQAPLPTPLCMWQWETNPKHTSVRDGWVAGVLAVERYCGWLAAKIENTESIKRR